MKTKEFACIHYEYEGHCDLNKEASFYHLCQTCPEYKAKPHSKPAREDTRRRKLDRIEKRSRNDD